MTYGTLNLGPYMSASRRPTLNPLFARREAKFTATVDFPTPPVSFMSVEVLESEHATLATRYCDNMLNPLNLLWIEILCLLVFANIKFMACKPRDFL
jgi:hypothetical protein